MAVWHLHRDTFTDQGVLGKLEGGGGLVFETIENPDTLIPAGEWACVRDYYHKGGYPTFEIIVPGRDRLLFHAANYAEELEGCIAPGLTRGTTLNIPGVFHSRSAMDEFMNANTGLNAFRLVITEGNNID